MILPEQLRAIADRLEAAETERQAALLELRRVLALHPVSWDPSEPNADDVAAAIEAAKAIESPVSPAGADAEEEPARALPVLPSAPNEQAVPDGSQGRDSAAASPQPASSPAPPDASDAGAVRDGRRPTRSEGVGSTPTPRSTPRSTHQDNAARGSASVRARGPYACPDCGREFALPQNVSNHRRAAHPPAPKPQERAKPRTDHPWRAKESKAVDVSARGKETFLCGRCPMQFDTAGALNLHLIADHKPEPRGNPVGTRRPLSHPHIPGVPGGGHSMTGRAVA